MSLSTKHVKRKPFGQHDGNRQVPKRQTTSLPSPSMAASSRRNSLSLHKPPLPPSSTKKSRTPAVVAKENTRRFDGSSKTPRISNLERSRHGSVVRALDGSRTQESHSAASHGVRCPSHERPQHKDKKRQKLETVIAERSTLVQAVSGRAKNGQGSLHSLAHVSNSTASGTKGWPSPFASRARAASRDKPPRSNVAASYLLSGGASKKKPSVLEQASVHETLGQPKQEALKRLYKDASVPSSNRRDREEESVGGMDCDSDEQSLGLSSPESRSPPESRHQQELAVDQDKDWKLTVPHKPEGHSKVVESEREDDKNRNSVLHRALLHGSTQNLESPAHRRSARSRSLLKEGRRPVVTKGMMRRAREAEVDNKDAIAAMLASRPLDDPKDRECRSSPILDLEVNNYHSADESELTMRTLQDYEKAEKGVQWKEHLDRNAPRNNDVEEQAKSHSTALQLGSRAEERGLPLDGRQLRDSHHERREGAEYNRDVQSRQGGSLHEKQPTNGEFPGKGNHLGKANDAVSAKSRELWESHPPLPPGWDIRFSNSKNRVYYVHPERGATWWCPVPLNNGETSLASIKADATSEHIQKSTSGLFGRARDDYQRDKSFDRSSDDEPKPAIVQDASSPQADKLHRAATPISREATLGALLESLNSNYDADESAEITSQTGERALDVPSSPHAKGDDEDEFNQSMPIDEHAGVSPGFVADQSPIAEVEEIVSTVHLKRGKEISGETAEILVRSGSKASDTPLAGNVAERGELEPLEPCGTSFDGVGDDGDAEMLGHIENPLPKGDAKRESPLQSHEFDIPLGAEESIESEREGRMGSDWQLNPKSGANGTEAEANSYSSLPKSPTRNLSADDNPRFNDAGSDNENSFSSLPNSPSGNFEAAGDTGFNDSDSGAEDANSFSSQSNGQSKISSQMSRRRMSQSYGSTSSVAWSTYRSRSDTSVRRRRATKYRPSWRITNPRAPLCSLQRLFLNSHYTEVSPETSPESAKASSTKKTSRRSGKAYTIKKRLW